MYDDIQTASVSSSMASQVGQVIFGFRRAQPRLGVIIDHVGIAVSDYARSKAF